MGYNFIYFGKSFSFDMNNTNIKAEPVTDMNKYFDNLNWLPLHPKHKLLIIAKYIYSILKWRFSIYNITSTWVIQNLDSIAKEYTKRCLHLPHSANTRYLYLPAKRLGMKLILPPDAYNSNRLTTRNILNHISPPKATSKLTLKS